MSKIIPLEISARHLHLSQKSLQELFGKSYQLTEYKALSQPGEFATQEKVTVFYQGQSLKNVRIVGPVRKQSQLELTLTDCRQLKLVAPIRLSGDLKGAPQVEIRNGRKKSSAKAIVAKRHLHIDPKSAAKYKLTNGKLVSVFVKSPERELTFSAVTVRVAEKYKLSAHIDTDEANAAGLDKCSVAKLIF